MLLHFVQSSNESQSSSQKQREYNNYSDIVLTTTDLEAHMSESCKMVSKSYGIFKSKAAEQVGGNQLSFFSLCFFSLFEKCVCQCSIVLALGFVDASFWFMLEVLSKWLAYQLQEI